MNLESFRDEAYARKKWMSLRPFYCRLSPEFLWREVRAQIIEELNEEIQANASKIWEYATYFTYPTGEQMESIHEQGLFFSEIREIVGYRSAEALSLLAGFIRLEADGDIRTLLEELFQNLWQSFSQHGYGHGYDTPNTRSDLVLMLASNNVFGLVQDRSWIDGIRKYFLTDFHPWSGRPLRESKGHVLRALGEIDDGNVEGEDNLIIKGLFDLNNEQHTLESLVKALYWEQGRPEQFNSAAPRSIFYRLPYHLIKFQGWDKLDVMKHRASDPFSKTVIHFLTCLCLRSKIVESVGIGSEFTLQHATDACKGDEYAARMTLGQMIKTGIVEFDTSRSWVDDAQRFTCVAEAQWML